MRREKQDRYDFLILVLALLGIIAYIYFRSIPAGAGNRKTASDDMVVRVEDLPLEQQPKQPRCLAWQGQAKTPEQKALLKAYLDSLKPKQPEDDNNPYGI